jgi:RNA ligase
MKLNKENILKLIDEGYLIVNKHPDKELYIYNYSKTTQFERYWNELTLMCRGLVLDADYNIVARPFNKFFNLEEDEGATPNLPFEVFEKMDGSCIILFNHENEWIPCTRGSFISDQALKAKEMLKKHDLSKLDISKTYLFEIIY